MSTVKVQAISGVSAGDENIVMAVFPSVSSTLPGKLIGSLYELIPIKIFGVKISHVLCTLAVFPVLTGALLYFLIKIFGDQYVLTNRSVQRRKVVGFGLVRQAPLSEIASVEIEQQPGQKFYHAADLNLLDSSGGLLLRLDAVPRADVFRQTILEARDSQSSVAASLATINARHG